MNAGEALNLLLRRVGDPNGDRLGPAEAMLLIDQGVIAFNRETEILRAEVQLVAATVEPYYALYDRPADVHRIDTVEYLGECLQFATPAQLRRVYSDWRTEQGRPWYYLLPEDYVQIAPFLTDAAVIYCEYIRNPGRTADLGRIDLPTAYELAPISWAAAEWDSQNSDRRENDRAQGWMAEFALMVEQGRAVAETRGTKAVRRVGRRYV